MTKEITEIKEMIHDINEQIRILSHNYVEIKMKISGLENPMSCVQREIITEHDVHIKSSRIWIRKFIFAVISIIFILLCSTAKIIYDAGIISSKIEQNTASIKVMNLDRIKMRQ